MPRRDIVAIGASAGGVRALQEILRSLPAELKAAVLIVQHTPPYWPSLLPELLQRVSALPILVTEDDMPITGGNVYLPPRDQHLIVHRGVFRLRHGTRQSGARPAIDPLFRSVAVEFGSRVIGVILSGLLDDGAAGIASIRACGGVCVVQDPKDAEFPAMPENAIDALDGKPDVVLPLAAIATHITKLVGTSVPEAIVPGDLAALVEESFDNLDPTSPRSHPVQLTCPECGGSVRSANELGIERYECHVGHTFAPEVLASEQALQVERALWAGVRLLEERAAFLSRLADNAEDNQRRRAQLHFLEQARQASAQAVTMRQLLVQLPGAALQAERNVIDR
jgi:two-component system chemotaxis response regulator CheB